jgi:hypothetical protein
LALRRGVSPVHHELPDEARDSGGGMPAIPLFKRNPSRRLRGSRAI